MTKPNVTGSRRGTLVVDSSNSRLRPLSNNSGASSTPALHSKLNARLANRDTPDGLTVRETQKIVNGLVAPATVPSMPLNARTSSQKTRFLSTARSTLSEIFASRDKPVYEIIPQWTLEPGQLPKPTRIGNLQRKLKFQYSAQVKAQAHEHVIANSGMQSRHLREQRDETTARMVQLTDVELKLEESNAQMTAAHMVFDHLGSVFPSITKDNLDQAKQTQATLLNLRDGLQSQLQSLTPLPEPGAQSDLDVEQALLQTHRLQKLQALQDMPPGFEGTPMTPHLQQGMRQLAQRLGAPEGPHESQVQAHQNLIPSHEALEIILRCLALSTRGQGDQAAQVLDHLMGRSIADLVPRAGGSFKDQPQTTQSEQAIRSASHRLASALLELPGGRELLKRLAQPTAIEPSPQVQDAVAVYFKATHGLNQAANDDSRQWLQAAQEASQALAHPGHAGPGHKDASLSLTLSQQTAFNGVRNGLTSLGPGSTFDNINAIIEKSLDDWPKGASAQTKRQTSPWDSRGLLKEATHDLNGLTAERNFTKQLKIACEELLKATTQQLVAARSDVVRARGLTANVQPLVPGAPIGLQTKVPMPLIEAHNLLHYIKERLDQDVIPLLNPRILRSIEHTSKRQQNGKIVVNALPSEPLKGIRSLDMASPATPRSANQSPLPSPLKEDNYEALVLELSKLKANHSTPALQAMKMLSASIGNWSACDVNAPKSTLIVALNQADELQERYSASKNTEGAASPTALFELMSQNIADPSKKPTFGSVRLSDSRYTGLETSGLITHGLAVISAGTVTPEFEIGVNRSKTSSLSMSRDSQGIQQHLVSEAVTKRVKVHAGLGLAITFWASHERAWVDTSKELILRIPLVNGKTHEQLTVDIHSMTETLLTWRNFVDEAHQPIYKNPLQALLHRHPEVSISALMERGGSHINNRNLKNLTGLIEPVCDQDGSQVILGALTADSSSSRRRDTITTTSGTQGIEVVSTAKVANIPNHQVKKNSLTVDTAGSVLFRQPDGSILAERSAAYTRFSEFEATVNLHHEKWIHAGMQAANWPESTSQSEQRIAANENLDRFMSIAKTRSFNGNVTLKATMKVKPEVCAEITSNVALEQLARADGRRLEADILQAARVELLSDEASYQADRLELFENGSGSKNVGFSAIIARRRVQMASVTQMFDCYPPIEDAVSAKGVKG